MILIAACIYVRAVCIYIIMQITESEIVSENSRFRCEEQAIHYYRLNPTINEVATYRQIKSQFKTRSCLLMIMQGISAGVTDLAVLVDVIMNTRCYTVANLDFHKLILTFEKIQNCRKLLSPSYSEKIQKLVSSCKNELTI